MALCKPPTTASPKVNERLFAFLDDTFIVTPTAAEVGTAYGDVREALRNHCGIHVHVG